MESTRTGGDLGFDTLFLTRQSVVGRSTLWSVGGDNRSVTSSLAVRSSMLSVDCRHFVVAPRLSIGHHGLSDRPSCHRTTVQLQLPNTWAGLYTHAMHCAATKHFGNTFPKKYSRLKIADDMNMLKYTVAATAVAATLASAKHGHDAVKVRNSTPDMLFFSMGDWGGASDTQPTTDSEIANGKGMQAVSDHLGLKPRFVMAVGDNFYGVGIQGSEYSSRFQTTFEDVFTEEALECPWYVIAGNHDHKGNVTAQIDYTNDSKRWTFPSPWYTWTAESGDSTSTQVVYIDTVVLAGMSYKDDETGEIVSGEPHPVQAMADEQLTWLEDTLANSTADYLWVSGHYPVYSQCEHGPTDDIIDNVLPLLKKYNASGYIAGHDHCSGHYEDSGLSFVVAGAGKECCYDPANLDNEKNPGQPLFRMDSDQTHDAIGGFASYSVTAESTIIRYHDQDGSILYQGTPVAPRTQTAHSNARP